MKPIRTFECPHLALLKSVATQVLADQSGKSGAPKSFGRGAGIDLEHPLLRGIDRYCEQMHAGKPPAAPPPVEYGEEVSDPDILAYLTYLRHRHAHARIADDPALEADLEAQLHRFKYGNPLWQQMFVEYFKYYWQYPYHLGGRPHYRSWRAKEFGNGDAHYGVIDWRLPSKATIAVIGDIGTGTDVAAGVLLAALSFRPDAILHVGDVYYSGTPFEVEHRFAGLFESVFRDQGRAVPVFTVPGNHEYFTGAVAFLSCLDSRRLAVERGQGQDASYFCLRSEDEGWQFLGLDTGFHGHYMDVPASAQAVALRELHLGKLAAAPESDDAEWPTGGPPLLTKRRVAGAELPVEDPTRPAEMVYVRGDEVEWHAQKLVEFPGRSVLLSHHQLYSAVQKVGVDPANAKSNPPAAAFDRAWVNTRLWQQFGPHFGDRVAAWFWGHEHNLGIYRSDYRPQDWPDPTAAHSDQSRARDHSWARTLPKGRCCGHSAIPVQASEHPYAAKYPVPLEQPGLELALDGDWYNRGFQILKLGGAGNPMRASYYQIKGADPTPIEIYSESIA